VNKNVYEYIDKTTKCRTCIVTYVVALIVAAAVATAFDIWHAAYRVWSCDHNDSCVMKLMTRRRR